MEDDDLVSLVRNCCLVLLVLLSGCARSKPAAGTSPKTLLNEFDAALADFRESLPTEQSFLKRGPREEHAEAYLAADAGALLVQLDSLSEATRDRPEIQSVLKSMRDTVEQIDKSLKQSPDLVQIRQTVEKLQQDAATLRQKL